MALGVKMNQGIMSDAAAGVMDWSTERVVEWAHREKLSQQSVLCIRNQDIDGKSLLALSENDIRDFRDKCHLCMTIGDIKRFWIAVRTLQKENAPSVACLGLNETLSHGTSSTFPLVGQLGSYHPGTAELMHFHDIDRVTPPLSVDGRATNVPPEVFKTVISLVYSFLVTWITAFVMVVVHERVPDMKRYPPLPDIFLDNVPHIPWAFHMCEITGTLLFTIWLCVCIFHKYRLVLLRRFFALAGTVFLLRCVTMLITSLSVPGTHLQCNPNDYKVDDTNLTISEALELRISRAYTIWSGLGMSIQGVRTCGDYMFSGHTVALTLLNFFITEYTPRNLYFLHTLTWLLNMFGIFFILAAHEHYSIDVFVAFYITSRLFLYYHTLANNQALMSHDSNRTRIWFPMFSYFEASVDGIIPNEYDSISTLLSNVFSCVICVKDSFMLTARRFWINNPHFPPLSKTFLKPSTPKNSSSMMNSNNSNQQATENVQFVSNLNNAQLSKSLNSIHKNSTSKTNFVILNNDIRDGNLKNACTETNAPTNNTNNAKKEN